jgi:hypothetical protein
MPRYKFTPIINNNIEFYEFLRKNRQVKTNIVHYGTPVMHNPSAAERATIKTAQHMWTFGDRFYKLAAQYYGQPEYWWVIAWYNGYPTEVTVRKGHMLAIPLDLEEALVILRAY